MNYFINNLINITLDSRAGRIAWVVLTVVARTVRWEREA